VDEEPLVGAGDDLGSGQIRLHADMDDVGGGQRSTEVLQGTGKEQRVPESGRAHDANAVKLCGWGAAEAESREKVEQRCADPVVK